MRGSSRAFSFLLSGGLTVVLSACGGSAAPSAAPASVSAKPASGVAVASAPASAVAKASAAASVQAKPSAAPPPGSPAGAMIALIDAINRGDANAAVALFADNAVVIGGPPCGSATPCTSHDAIVKFWQARPASHTQYKIGQPLVAGNLVQVQREQTNDASKAAGVDRFVDLATALVMGGKIVGFSAANDISDAQTVKFGQYQAQQAAASASGANKPAASSDPVVVAARLRDAVASGDAAAGAAALTPNGALTGPPPCTLSMPCIGSADILKFTQGRVAVHQKDVLIGAPAVQATTVRQRAEIRNDSLAAAGVERFVVIETFAIQGEKIAGFLGVPDLSDAQTVKYQVFAQAAGATASLKPVVDSDQAKLLQQFENSINRGDSGGVMALFADDATFSGGPLCSPNCVGKAAIQKEVERGIGDHNQLHLIDVQTNGNVATSHTDWRSDATRRAGVDRRVVMETVEARDGKILKYSNQNDASDPETAKFLAFTQTQASAAAAAKPSAG